MTLPEEFTGFRAIDQELAGIMWQGACAIDASTPPARAPALARRASDFIAESLDTVRRTR